MKARLSAAVEIFFEYAVDIFETEMRVWHVVKVHARTHARRTFIAAKNMPVRAAVRSILRDPEFSHPIERLNAVDEVYEEAHHVIDRMRETQQDQESLEDRLEVENAAFDFWSLVGLSIFGCVAFLCVANLVYGYLSRWLDKGSNIQQNWDRAFSNWASLSYPDRVFVTVGLTCVPVLLFLLVQGLRKGIRRSSEEHEEVVEELLRPYLRLLLNNLSNQEVPARLEVNIAPGLGDTDIAERLIERPEIDRIRILNEELGAHSIAVSGPRGVGKTTLLKVLSIHGQRHAKNLRVLVSAPVTYEAREFLLHLYIKVCEHVLEVAGKPSRASVQFIIKTTRKTIRTIVFLSVALIVMLNTVLLDLRATLLSMGWPLPGRGISLLLVPTLILIWLLASRLRSGFVSSSTSAMVARCRDELQLLKFLQTTTTEHSGGFKKAGLEALRKRSRQLATRPHTLPELVGSYREFVEYAVDWWRTDRRPDARLTICIDEVDRIAKAEDAERFLNDIKAIFGVRYCNYLVTVSEDALAGFERRVVRVRPALDSAFDEVIRLDPFSFEQSKHLVQQSVIGMPDAFVMLCHCVAGGIPRDLVRAVRTTLDQRGRFDTSDVRSISEAVVASEVASLRRGLLTRILGTDTNIGPEILAILSEKSTEERLSLERVESVLGASIDGDYSLQTTQELGAALYYYYTVQEVLTDRRDLLLQRPVLADELAAIRASLPVSASLTKTQLDHYRERLDLLKLVTAQGDVR